VADYYAHGTPGCRPRCSESFSGRRHGLRDLTHELKTSILAFAPGEEPKRRTVVTIEDAGYYMTEWLLRRRGIRSLGVDTLSIDPGISETFDTHLILTGADRYGLENLANLDRIPRRGATIMVGLIPYEDGSGGQARIFASW
jgi:kynurenine formamidase